MKENKYFVSDGISNGKSWSTYVLKPNGSLRRVKSKFLPNRNTKEEAQKDLDFWGNHGLGRPDLIVEGKISH